MIARVRLAVLDPSAVREFLEDYQQDPNNPESALPAALADHYEGVTNGYLSQIYENITGACVEVIGDTADLLPCPCCHMKTLHERYNVDEGTGYEVCPECGWEDDGTSGSSVQSGVNSGSMDEYRARMESEVNYYYRAKWSMDKG